MIYTLPNLKAEMARHGVTVEYLSSHLNITTKTFQSKISGRGEFTLKEILLLHEVFSQYTLSYLFKIQYPTS